MAGNSLIKSERKPTFTVKAILFGLIGVVLINAFAQFSDTHLQQTLFVGNHFPIGAYAFVLLIALLWNPFVSLMCRLFGFSRRETFMHLSTREFAVTLGMCLTACWPPTSGLYRYFHRQLILPWLRLDNKPEWQAYGPPDPANPDQVHPDGILGYLQSKLFPLEGNVDDTVYRGFMQGLAKGNESIPWWDPSGKEQDLLDVLGAWAAPMAYWGPLLVLFVVCILAMALMVHRQWTHHEQLSYPLAKISNALIERDKGRATSNIFRSKLFWWGLSPVLFIYMVQMLHLWNPNYVPNIDLSWDVSTGFLDMFPGMRKIWTLYVPSGTLYFTIVGITYFLSSEIGLTMGLSQILLLTMSYQFFLATGTPLSNPDMQMWRSGAYVGYAAIMLFTGRHYYWAVLTKAFGLGRAVEHEKESVIACRLLAVGFVGMVGMLIAMGLDWLVALVYCGLMLLFFLVFARVVCETGVPFLQAWWDPGMLMAKVLGFSALGPGPLVFLYYLGTIFTQDPREALMPYVSTSLKVADDADVKRTPLLSVLFIAAIVALAVGFFATAFGMYNYGASEDGWAFNSVPQLPFDGAVKGISFLDSTGQLERATSAAGLEKLSLIQPDGRATTFAAVGLAAVVVFSLLRFRFSWWPIHAVLFLVWGTYPIGMVHWSFLIGWAVKALVVRFGGGRVYQNLKPLFIGLIIGELVAGALSIIIGFLYYYCTGLLPRRLIILPG